MLFNAYSDTTDGIFNVYLKSAGHIFAENGRSISRPNGREDWLLFYIAKGSETFFLDKREVAPEGSFIIFKPHERQEHTCFEDKTAEFFYIHFMAPENFDTLGLESSKVYNAKPSSKVRDLFEDILTELQSKQTHYEKVCVFKLFEIISLLSRRIKKEISIHKKHSDKITFVIQTMNKEYYENYTLLDYAKMCSMSKYHFLRIFRDITGLSPLEYRNRIRLEHAKDLLEDLSLSVNEIGFQLGFSSPSYFCEAFKKKTGVSPKRYREKIKEL